MTYSKGICSVCSKEELIVKKLPSIGKLCDACNKERLGVGKVPNKGLKIKLKKPTGEGVLFEMIWATRPHVCGVCGVNIHQPTASNFAHILPKGRYPNFRLLDANIMLMCHDINTGNSCHYSWDFEPRSSIINDAKWSKVIELEIELKEKYGKEI